MRISAIGFARIRDEQGRYCVLVNKGQLDRGKGRVLMPVGGAFESTPAGKKRLIRMGATDFEGKGEVDLRFRVPDQRVRAVVTWFERRAERETSVLRELREELVDETGVLARDDLLGIGEGYSGFVRRNGTTHREDVPERTTCFLIEVFDVRLPGATMRKLIAASRAPLAERWAYFVTANEVKARVSREGVEISSFTQHVL